MPSLTLKKKDIPFLLGGGGEVTVVSTTALSQSISETSPVLLSARFSAKGSDRLLLGLPGTVKLSVSTKENLQLAAVFSGSTGAAAKLLVSNGLGDFFKRGANSDKLILALDTGMAADVSATGSFSYSALKTSIEVKAGVDGRYVYLRAFDKSLPAGQILAEFFRSTRLPEQINTQLDEGEAVSLGFGGYLRLAAEASAGYRLAGTRSTSLGHMAVSEKYGLSVLGKIGLAAGIAGHFSVLITAAPGLPGWVRVQVRRQHSRDFKIAADVNVRFKNDLDTLPPSANEFLGAVLGVNAKNLLNVLLKAYELSDFEKLKAAVDGLARRYISELIGDGFERLGSETRFKAFLERVHAVVTSYEQVGDRAVTLFERFFHNLAELAAFLERILGLQPDSLKSLRDNLSPQLWNILSQLTDGDPLGFTIEQVVVGGGERIDSLPELKRRAAAVLDLVRNDSHAELRNAIATGRLMFDVDWFFRELAKIDTVEELQAVANDKVGQFVSRLVGRTLDSATNLKQALKEIKAVLDHAGDFGASLYKACKEASRNSYKIALAAGYSRAVENDALIDVLINATDRRSASLLAQAGRCDFEQVLTTSDAGLVRLQKGVFTHRLRLERSWNVNILGWHSNFQYEGFDRVITETEQRVIPSDRGLTVLTSEDLTVERLRKREDERTHVNFLLRALGESAQALRTDGDPSYFVDALESATARYRLDFTDEDTSMAELRDYLAFAADLHLDREGATLEALKPLLTQETNGSFGKVATSYDVRFDANAVKALLSLKQLSQPAEAAVRDAMRQMVLSNYLKSPEQHDVAFAYASPGVFDTFTSEGWAEFGNHSRRVFAVGLSNARIAAPSQVALDRAELAILITLYNIENSMVGAIGELYEVLNSGAAMDPRQFEKKLARFGTAMNDFDSFDQTTNKNGCGTSTLFTMFDALVRLASAGDPVNTAVLHMVSEANGKTVEKIFLSREAADAVLEKPDTATVKGSPGVESAGRRSRRMH